jgi:hypothetical protein
MKRLLLFIFLISSTNFISAQVVCAGVSPASIAGNYSFDWSDPANGWASPDFNVPGTSVTGELVLVDDGSVGNSPASGLPLANYGCATLVNSISGKIAMVYRYDGVTASTICWMSEKAKFAQDAGAIAVVVVNRPGASDILGNGGGTAASTVNIPVVLISYEDGASLRAEMENGPVTMFLGNKTGLFADDLGLVRDSSLIPKYTAVPPGIAQNGTDFNFNLGTRVYNYGNVDQGSVTITATVTDPLGATVYNNSVGPVSILSGDSVDVLPGAALSFPLFSLTSYPSGKYTLTYSVSNGGTDGYPGDNQLQFPFSIIDSLYSFAKLDPVTNLPVATAGYKPASNTNSFATCLVIDHPSASNLFATGIYFSAATGYGSGFSLTGEEMLLTLFRWEDPFIDLNDAGLSFNSLTEVAFGSYIFPGDLQNQTVFAPFSTPFSLENDQRFLACVQTYNTNIYLGHDVKTNYTWNTGYYLEPIGPNQSDGTYYAMGFGADKMPAMALGVCDIISNAICFQGIDETNDLLLNAFPNPTNGDLIVSIDADGSALITVSDITGRQVYSENTYVKNGSTMIRTKDLVAGVYVLSVQMGDGKRSQLNFIRE